LMQNPFRNSVFPEIKQLLEENGYDSTVIMNDVFQKHEENLIKGEHYLAYEWDNIFQHTFQKHHINFKVNIEELVLKYSVIPKVYLLENNIIYILEQLIERGYSLAVITNGMYKYQFPVMKALGVDNLFEAIITPQETRYRKPHSIMGEKLIKNEKSYAQDADKIDHDIVFANRVNAFPVYINRELPEEFLNDSPILRAKKVKYEKRHTKKYLEKLPSDIDLNAISSKEFYSEGIISS